MQSSVLLVIALLAVAFGGCIAPAASEETLASEAPSPDLHLSVTNTGVAPGWFWLDVTENGVQALTEKTMLLPDESERWTLGLSASNAYVIEATASANSFTRVDGFTLQYTLDSSECDGSDVQYDFTGYAVAGSQPGWSSGHAVSCDDST